VNKKELMGDHVNSRFYNIVAWATTVILIVLTLVYLWSLRGGS